MRQSLALKLLDKCYSTPHSPEESLQHVSPSGHSDWPSGQIIFLTSPFFFDAAIF